MLNCRYLACLCFGLFMCLVVASPASAKNPPLPPSLGFLAGVMNVEDVKHEEWTEYEFPPEAGPDTVKQGKRWRVRGVVNGNSNDKHVTWATLKAGFVASGWVEVKEFDTQPLRAIMHLKQNGLDVWADVSIYEPPKEGMEVIEVAPLPIALTLAPPASTPEKVVPAKGDFPYLAPLPGSRLVGGNHDPGPMSVTLPGTNQPENVASGYTWKRYLPADGQSQIEWFTVYHDALPKAGWTIINTFHSGDAVITAHYGLHGRNIWAYLHMSGGEYSFLVGDEGGGASGLSADLSTQCHVALTGVLFDFNKSTLKPESDAVLEKVHDLLGKDSALKLEVQGHTDDVGTDAYNQTLSEARAASVVAWLTQHGIASGRLSSKGYGKMMPVADNKTDEGRAKNRRVEIFNPACTPRRK
jgi:OmpA-OmpF porin, OOP family